MIEEQGEPSNNEEDEEEITPKIKYKSTATTTSLPSLFPSSTISPLPSSDSPNPLSSSSTRWNQIKSLNYFYFLKSFLSEVWYIFSPGNLRHIWNIFQKSWIILFLSKSTWSMGVYFLIIGLFFAFLAEILLGPKYNSLFLLTLMVSIAFIHFPKNSVRPQIVLTGLTCLTLVLDLIYLLRSPKVVSSACKSFLAFTILAKLFALYDFLWFSPGSKRARKYLIRRVRVFLIPFTRPRRLMREIRSRILALEWIQFAATIIYFGLFIGSISTAGFSSIMISPRAGLPLFVFFPVKSFLSAVIFFAFVVDTDLVLCLAYFGCLGWNMKYVKVYIHKKREANGGWPLPYGLNPYRFYVISAVKFIDVCWGFGGWVTLGTTFGAELNDRVIAITSATTVLLVITDIWCPILFYVVYDLLNLYKRELEFYEKNNESMESDDRYRSLYIFPFLTFIVSELDEFNIRNDQDAIAKARKSSRRHSKRMIRIESSEDDDSADSSPNSNRPKPTHKFNKKYSSVVQSGFDDAEAGLHSHNINLEMALGSSPGDNSSDEEDTPNPADDANQFVSSRRFSNEMKSTRASANELLPAPLGVIRSETHNFPPSGGHEVRAHPPILNSRLIQEKYRDRDGNEIMITIDDSTSVSPTRFTELWETLQPSATFGSLLIAESTYHQQHKLTQLIQHLQQNYFYIVAAGQVDTIITIYAFHSGYIHTPEDILDIYFLMELKLYFTPPPSSPNTSIPLNDEMNSNFWSFECICKCTDPAVSAVFIGLMHLGDILQQYYPS